MTAVADAALAERVPLPRASVAALGFVGAAAAATVALPLLVYTISLALFGIAHVLSELNYVDRRFSALLGGGVSLRIGAPIGIAAAAYAAGLTGLLPPRAAVAVELAAAAGLVFGVVGRMRRWRVVGCGIGLVIAAGALAAPFQLLLLLALLHNLTPLGFFAEALSGTERRRAVTLLAVPLVVLPLVIATGLPFAGLTRLGLASPEARWLASGPLALNLGVYVPGGLVSTDWALHAFSAAVFAQIMHYTAVIVLLPRLLDGAPSRTRLPWPRKGWLVPMITVAAIGFALVFVFDYQRARQLYALAALAHGWVEIPILLLAWGGLAAAQPAKA